jgi:hypothetical protein
MQKYVVLLVFVLKIINEFFIEARFIEIKTVQFDIYLTEYFLYKCM